jgi:hypothetical protein
VEFDEGLDRPAKGGRLDLGGEPPDDAFAAEPVNPTLGSCGRQSDQSAESCIAIATVVREARNNLVINLV